MLMGEKRLCISSLDSHKKCFLLHTGHVHQVACAQTEDIKTRSHTNTDEDRRMGRFNALFPKMLYFDIKVLKTCNRR